MARLIDKAGPDGHPSPPVSHRRGAARASFLAVESGVTVLSKNARRVARHRSEMQRARGRAIANRLKHDGAQAGLDPKLWIVAMQLLHQGLLTEQQVNAGIEIAKIYGEYERAIGAPRRSAASPHYGDGYGERVYGQREILVDDERAIRARKRKDDVQAVFNDLPVGHKDRIQATIQKLFVDNLPIPNAELPSIRPVLDQAAVLLGFALEPRSQPRRRAAVKTIADAVPATKYRAFRVKDGELSFNNQFIIELAKMAKVPNSKARNFEISEMFKNWLHFTSGKINQSATVNVLNKLIDAANVLHRLLQSLEDECSRRVSTGTLWEKSWKPISEEIQEMLRPQKTEDVLFSVRAGLRLLPLEHDLDCEVDIPGLLHRLSDLLSATKDLRKATTGAGTVAVRKATGVGRGAPLGSRGYPGLDWLVFFLERSAQAAGGSFTVNKRDRKGSLLDALDLLRVHLLACPDLKPLADLIPLPSQHPIATYQRAINRARNHSSTNAQGWSAPHKF